jgi:acyl carrier protein
MPAHPPVVSEDSLAPLVLRLIAETLVIPAERVTLATRLVEDLGAESIDFLDLAFRIGEALAAPVQLQRWQRFLVERLSVGGPGAAITAATILEFAELVRSESAVAQELRSPQSPP